MRDWCRTVAGRYPLTASSPSDISGEDFARVFGPGQLMDTFVTEQLKPFIDTSTRPWRWRADLGIDNKALAPFEQAAGIRAALFGAGSVPMMSFTLEPKDLTPQAGRVTLDLDGQTIVYFNSATRPQQMTWPGKDLTGVITLSCEPVDGSPGILATESGTWAWLRVLREGRLQATDLPELFKLRLSAQGYWADFDLRANSVENPFDLKMFANFTCPNRF